VIAAITRSRVAGSTRGLSFNTRLTVPTPTAASRATSRIVGAVFTAPPLHFEATTAKSTTGRNPSLDHVSLISESVSANWRSWVIETLQDALFGHPAIG
jgi:hypothetical protein